MNIRPALAFLLCGALVCSANATPIHYAQIGDAQQVSGNGSTSELASATTGSTGGIVSTSRTVESLDQPEFVRLADGRLVPYGPGVICSDICVEPEAIENPPGLSRRWLIAIPIAGAAIAAVLLASGETSIPRPTNVGGASQDPTPTTPTPTPTPCVSNCSQQPEPVPEPGTITLLGAGLAWLSRKRLVTMFRRKRD